MPIRRAVSEPTYGADEVGQQREKQDSKKDSASNGDHLNHSGLFADLRMTWVYEIAADMMVAAQVAVQMSSLI
jgi:hypothetical protein